MPHDLYARTLDYLTNGLYKGLQDVSTLEEVRLRDPFMISKLRENLQYFSAGKTYTQVRELSKLLTGPNGVRSLSEFQRLAMPILGEYNKQWLAVEYDAVVGQAQAASSWLIYEEQKEDLPLLRYVTMRDSLVRESHRRLDGLTLPVNHPRWRTDGPKNGWNCRCDFQQVVDGVESDISQYPPLTPDEQPPVFHGNPGIDRQAFKKTHPYFKVRKSDKEWAQAGYGLFTPSNE